MIQFPCKCGYAFEVPLELAGSPIQCPTCGLLADVPSLQDLPHLDKDGTFTFGDNTPPAEAAADVHFSFVNKTTDNHGQIKDLRHTVEQLQAIGLQEQIAPRPAPRYDPETGELIRPLQFKDETPVPVISIGELVDPSELDEQTEEIPQEVIPLPSPASLSGPVKPLGYATANASRLVTAKNLAIELLMPGNAVVMFFVFLFYIVAYYVTVGIASYAERFPIITWPLLIVNIPMWLVVAQAGCTIEETGPHAMDDLPRPLRDLSLGEDILGPIFSVALSGLICFGPLAWAYHALNPTNPATYPLILLIAVFGTAIFPAVVLTKVTGSTLLNLRPDRVVDVIRICGGNYVISIALFLAATIPSVYYLAAELLFRLPPDGSTFPRLEKPAFMFLMMSICVYLLHFFCWHLGLMYRQHHQEFPWIAQRHIKKEKVEDASSV